MKKIIPVALTIAGSDSGAGAGIQADIKTFSHFGVYATTVITAITAQNTLGVQKISVLSANLVKQQIESVMTDLSPRVWKTGMLGNKHIVSLVAKLAADYKIEKLVVDPVLLSKNRKNLLAINAMQTLIEKLIQLSYVVTPNCNEASNLTNIKINNIEDMKKAVITIHKMGAKYVVVKGGHLPNTAYSIDILYDGKRLIELTSKRIKTKNTHGTGCTFATSIAANLAKGENIYTSVKIAKKHITDLLKNSKNYKIGHGTGPLWTREDSNL